MREPGHPKYLQILDQMRELHIKKDQDYAGDAKPFDNFRSSSEIGIKPSTGAFIRLQDKFKRIQNLLMRENRGVGAAVADESIEDTLLDLASYALIVLTLRGEEKPKVLREFPINSMEDLLRAQNSSVPEYNRLAREIEDRQKAKEVPGLLGEK